MKSKPLCFFEANDVIQIEKLPTEEETSKAYQRLGLEEGTEATILWKSKGKIILKTKENKLAISKRAAEKIIASLL